MKGVNGLDGWQWYSETDTSSSSCPSSHFLFPHRIFIIFGIISVFFGVITFFFLVDNPHSKWLALTPEEKEIVDERTRDNAVVKSKEFQWNHIWEAVKEVRLWCFCFASMFMMITNGFFTIYSSTVVASFGFSVSLKLRLIADH